MARISYARRQKLPSSKFALPGKGTGSKGKGPGSYPIDTIGRARNALSRGAQHASPGELATIKRKVHAEYPSIDQGKKTHHNRSGHAHHAPHRHAHHPPHHHG